MEIRHQVTRRAALEAMTGASAVAAASAWPAARPSDHVARAGTRTLLFFDDSYLTLKSNVRRCAGVAQPAPNATYVHQSRDLVFSFPVVHFDREVREWTMLLNGPLCLQSADGLQWNEVKVKPAVHIANFYFDERAKEASARWKGFGALGKGRMDARKPELYCSPDGVDWTPQGRQYWPEATDPHFYPFWNWIRRKFVIVGRPSVGERKVAVCETADWTSYSRPELALQTDALDSPMAEIYGMPVFPYEGMFVGLLWLFHTAPDPAGSAPAADSRRGPAYVQAHKFFHGRVDCQLAYSYNGWHFHRFLREPLMAPAQPEEFGAGCVFPTTLMVDESQSIRIYSSASRVEHAVHQWAGAVNAHATWDRGAILLHRLRLDGFACLAAEAGPGEIELRPLYWKGGELALNVQAPWGEAKVQAMDIEGRPLEGLSFQDCRPFTGDSLFWEPEWSNSRRLSRLAGSFVRLRIRLTNAKLFAVRGNFIATTAPGHIWTAYERNAEPPLRPGF